MSASVLSPSASAELHTSRETPRVYGIAAEFSSTADIYHAAEQVRDAGFKRWDVHSPFPIHGMDDAMGLGRSRVSLIALCAALTGTTIGFVLETYPSIIEYPLVVHGKPVNLFTIPAFFPVIFELTILCCAFGSVFGMLALNRLPRWNHPLFNWDRFARVTDDLFVLAIEADDPKFQETRTAELLQKVGGKNITLIYE